MRHLIAFFLLIAPALAQEPIRYTLRFPQPHTHYVEVTASVPAGKPAIELFMAVWTPGSYLVREYARNVEGFKAVAPGGNELAWRKTRKNRWQVDAAGAARVEVGYRVYAHEMSVQGNWVDAGFAMLNGAPNFMTLVGGERRPYEVRVELPAAWRTSISGMKNGSAANTWLAADFDELLDCPIYAGSAPIHEFEVEGKKHYLVNEGEGPMWDGPASARDVAKIVAEYSRQWGGLPYEKYVFFNMIVESGGGLEHKNSTWLGASRWAYGNTQEAPENPAAVGERSGRRPSRLGWLGLVSHEYFHLWNVKRLRPVELGPFDYENEVYTRSLWLAEGVTSYYGPLALRRAGLSTREQFLRSMGQTIGQLQKTPGRLVTPVESASFNAWIQLYRPNENSPNTAISYYTKGDVVGFLLDAKIRKATGGAKSLDDAMKLAYARYGGARGYTPEQFRAVCNEVARADFGAWFKNALETTEELDYKEVLEWYGLRFRPEPARGGGAPRILTGISANTASGRIVVSGLRRGTAGYDAGLNVDDEILAVSGYRVRAEQWPSRLENYKPGETVDLLISRRDKLMTLKMPVVGDKPQAWGLEVRPDATEEQKGRLKGWLRE
ncbi:MAG: M61 family metallopeptidase [Candidatus Solibacter usitatus]|nr:M61 family metallopeptidase [Candidatus Solibacter usitatus]